MEFEVIKFCQQSESPCRGCHDCDDKDKAKKYSIDQNNYDKNFQQSVDSEIDGLMEQGLSRTEAVLKISENEERALKWRT